MAKMFVHYSGNLSTFKTATNAEGTLLSEVYFNSIVFIKGTEGDAIYTHGAYYADAQDLADAIASLTYVEGIKVGDDTYKPTEPGPWNLAFEATDPATVEINATAEGIKIGLNQTWVDSLLKAADQVVKSVDDTADSGVALALDENGKLAVTVTEGAVADGNTNVVLGGQVYAAIKEVSDALAAKNVTASGETGDEALVTAGASNNNVTVASTARLKEAVANVEKLGSAAFEDTTAFDVAGAAETAKKEILGYTEGEDIPATDAQTIKGINDRIDAVVGDAKSYSVVAVTGDELAGLGANVKEAYKLVDEDSAKSGEYIKIYKDSALQKVELDGQDLVFTYLLTTGVEDVVRVDVSNFLAESEFKDGLQVVDHVVSVKVDPTSESFLTVGANGVKLAGVQDAIDAAVAGLVDAAGDDYVSATAEGNKVTVEANVVNIASVTEGTTALLDAADAKAYIDTQDSATLTSANGYADNLFAWEEL